MLNNCSFLYCVSVIIQSLTYLATHNPLPLTVSYILTPADEVTMEEVGQTAQLRAGELIIIVVVLIMWAGEDTTVY